MPDYDYDDQITLTRGDLVPAVLILEGLVEALELLGGRWARESAARSRPHQADRANSAMAAAVTHNSQRPRNRSTCAG